MAQYLHTNNETVKESIAKHKGKVRNYLEDIAKAAAECAAIKAVLEAAERNGSCRISNRPRFTLQAEGLPIEQREQVFLDELGKHIDSGEITGFTRDQAKEMYEATRSAYANTLQAKSVADLTKSPVESRFGQPREEMILGDYLTGSQRSNLVLAEQLLSSKDWQSSKGMKGWEKQTHEAAVLVAEEERVNKAYNALNLLVGAEFYERGDLAALTTSVGSVINGAHSAQKHGLDGELTYVTIPSYGAGYPPFGAKPDEFKPKFNPLDVLGAVQAGLRGKGVAD